MALTSHGLDDPHVNQIHSISHHLTTSNTALPLDFSGIVIDVCPYHWSPSEGQSTSVTQFNEEIIIIIIQTTQSKDKGEKKQ